MMTDENQDKPLPMNLPSYNQQHILHSWSIQAIWQVYDATESGSTIKKMHGLMSHKYSLF